MYLECSRGKNCETSPAGYVHGKGVDLGPGGVITSPTLLGPVLVWSQHNYLRLLKNGTYFVTSYGFCPGGPLQRKSGYENE